jgi:DNA-directed RNA polymerase subunit F
MPRVSTTALVAALVAVAANGCHHPTPSVDVDAGATAPAAATGAGDPGQVLARVGARTITLGDYEAALEHMDQFDRLRYRAPERRRELLDEMIDVALLADEARDRGYDHDPETQEELRQILRDAVLQTVRDGAPAPNDIPEADVRAYYEAHRADFRDPERRRVSAIVLGTEAAASSALAAAVALPAASTAWGDLVRSRSIDANARADVPGDLAGDFGFVNAPGQGEGDRGANPRVPDEVRSAVFDVARVGDVLPRVVKVTAPGGARFFVVKLAAKSDAHDRTLQDAERSIRVKLAQDALRAREAALIDDLRKQFPVVIDEAALSRVHVGDAG